LKSAGLDEAKVSSTFVLNRYAFKDEYYHYLTYDAAIMVIYK